MKAQGSQKSQGPGDCPLGLDLDAFCFDANEVSVPRALHVLDV